MKFCIIYNKKSAGGRKSKFIKKIYEEIQKNHQIVLFDTKSEKEASKIIKDVAMNKYNRLILAGGDGSVSFAVNELLKNNFDPPENFALGYIPAGTVNMLQAELNMKKKVSHIVKTLTSNKIQKANLVKINDKYFILMAGFGWDAQIVQSINPSIKKILGKIIFGIKGLQKFIFMNNNKIKVSVDNEEIYADWILCLNTKFYAGHYPIANTNIFENKIVSYIFKDLKRIKLLYYIYLIIFYGDLSKSTSVITKTSDHLILDGLENDIPIQIDGDDFGNHRRITILNSNKSLNLITA